MRAGGVERCASCGSSPARAWSISGAAPATCAGCSDAPGCRAVGVDMAAGMLAKAHTSAPLVRADALALPLRDASVDGAISGFALRNVVDIGACFGEAARVIRPGGRAVFLEVSEPPNPDRAPRCTPSTSGGSSRIVGGLLSDRSAYRYLPASTAYLPSPNELLALLADAGFSHCRRVQLGHGRGTAPDRDPAMSAVRRRPSCPRRRSRAVCSTRIATGPVSCCSAGTTVSLPRATSRAIHVPAGAAPRPTCGIARPGRLSTGPPGLGVAMGALPYDGGSCDAVLRLPERVHPGSAAAWRSRAAAAAGRSRSWCPTHSRSTTRPRWSARWRPSRRARSRRSCSRERCRWRRTRRSMPASLARRFQRRGTGGVRVPRGAARGRLAPGRRLAGARRPAQGTEGVQRPAGRDRPPVAGSHAGSGDRPATARHGEGAARASAGGRGGRRRTGAVLLEPHRRQRGRPDVDGDALASPHGDQGDAQTGRARCADHRRRTAPHTGGVRNASGGGSRADRAVSSRSTAVSSRVSSAGSTRWATGNGR